MLCREELLLLGDFNICVDAVDDNDATKFSDLLESLGLVQHVEHATHVHGHTLDLIISRKSNTTIHGAPRIDRSFCLIMVLFTLPSILTDRI